MGDAVLGRRMVWTVGRRRRLKADLRWRERRDGVLEGPGACRAPRAFACGVATIRRLFGWWIGLGRGGDGFVCEGGFAVWCDEDVDGSEAW